MRLVLFQPDIPQNAGALLRLAACWTVPVDLIEPCGFLWDDRRLRRAGMDYLAGVDLTRHSSWDAYQESAKAGRLLLLTTRGSVRHTDFAYAADDRLMVGRESSGVPDAVHAAAAARLRVPMARDQRSLNVALAAGVVLGEGLRQTMGFPGMGVPE